MIERIDDVGTKAYDDAHALRQTVQELPDARKDENGASSFWSIRYGNGTLLPPWGTRQREWELRRYYHHEYNWMGQSAFAGLTKKWAATPWDITGKNRVPYFQELLRGADFGRGWDSFIQKVGLDFLRQDGGAYIEIIAPGNPLRPPTGPATGLSVLDSLRCYPTGDPDYPVIYYDRKGGKHLMHRSRVVQIVDAPDAAETNPGYGTCALSRAIAIVAQQINMNHYAQTNLDDKPKPGYVVLSGMTVEQRKAAEQQQRIASSTDDPDAAGSGTVFLHSINPEAEIKMQVFSWAQPPANYSYKEYTELHTNAWALALGIDVQELWQLTGGNIGSAGQSQVLHAKSQGKTFGAFLIRMERLLNDVLPPSLEFQFVVKDEAAEAAAATTAGLWSTFVSGVGSTLSADEQRRLLAAVVEQYRDVVTDENGEIVTLDDADPEGADPTTGDDTGAAPDAPTDIAPDADAPVTVDSQKDITATRADFISDFTDLVRSSIDGDTNRRRAGIVLRAQLNRLGRQAYKDGMTAGGVEEDLDSEDLSTLASWVVDQSAYVTGFLDEVYGKGLSDAQLEQRAEMWANKSLDGAYNLGLASADRNGMYQWSYDPIKESCSTCIKLNGQVHRLKDYVSRDFMPHSSKLECKGYLCGCVLTKTKGAARGQWPVVIVT